VSDKVTRHEGFGAGSYVYFDANPTLHATHGFEVPATPGVRLHDVFTVNLGAGTIDHVVDDAGDPATTAAIGVPSCVARYPAH